MRPFVAVLLTLAVALSSPGLTPISGTRVNAQASNSCVDCEPAIDQHTTWHGQLTVCFDLLHDGSAVLNQFTDDQINWMKAGMEYWYHPFEDTGVDITFTYETATADVDCSQMGYDILVTPDTAIPYQDMALSGPSSGIHVNTNELSNTTDSNRWNYLGGHEMGHVMGFHDVDNSDCDGLTMMYNQYGSQSVPTTSDCSDLLGVTNQFVGGSRSNGYEGFPSESTEDCYDYYYVQYHWFYSSNLGLWVCSGYVNFYFVETSCDGPPDF